MSSIERPLSLNSHALVTKSPKQREYLSESKHKIFLSGYKASNSSLTLREARYDALKALLHAIYKISIP